MSLTIASQTSPAKTYELNIDPVKGRITCTCPAYRFATGLTGPCKHVRQLSDLLKNQIG
jgi:hypothetical protein